MDQASAKLIYQNLACGVTPEAQARALDCSVEEVERVFRAVGLAIANWQLQETMPYTPCQTPTSAMQNRKVLLQLLDKLDIDSVVIEYHRIRAARCAVEN
ncbi:hypothetical protein [Burkholderia pseudomallei]|uniref:hypothetical protein n=1 Tax=Burkholderia pseudomallei TaxID=28450 RepID=UPI001326FA8B|nr:hypothetical protein [Burkholderia pseudomallei]MBF3874204.1 hypothetical protein [Burkholderia pseudomallei]MBF3906480.1 hypothetical protein [Burkholderia pseudomallei]MWA18459.1 hypothetical protein [Burkholderia pseudomallei]